MMGLLTALWTTRSIREWRSTGARCRSGPRASVGRSGRPIAESGRRRVRAAHAAL